jgi:small redox-active disulfide protein 2
MLTIKVLGPGCSNCKRMEQLAQLVVKELDVDAYIEKITDYTEIMRYPILSTPGLVIDEQLVCSGRIPNRTEVTTWITTALEHQSQAV